MSIWRVILELSIILSRAMGMSLPAPKDLTTGILLVSPNAHEMMYTPVIVPKRILKVEKEIANIYAVRYFPSPNDHAPVRRFQVGSNDVLPTNPKKIIVDRRVKNINHFDYSKLDNIHEVLKSDGAITFLIEDIESASKFVSNLGVFEKTYNNVAFVCSTKEGRVAEVKGDRLVFFITIFDLPYAIPIYSHKRANGMAISFGTFWIKSTMKKRKFLAYDETSFVVNEFPDNITVIDGEVICSSGLTSQFSVPRYISRLCKTMKGDITLKDEVEKSDEVKGSEEIPEGQEVKRNGNFFSMNDYACSTVSTSSTSGNY